MPDLPLVPDWLQDKVRPFELPQRRDERGALTPIEFEELPFVPRRLFFVTASHPGVIRGEHGHRTGTRLLLCTMGEIRIKMRDGVRAHAMTLCPNGVGLLIRSGLWMQEEYVSPESVLAVLTDLRFHEEEYFYDPLGNS